MCRAFATGDQTQIAAAVKALRSAIAKFRGDFKSQTKRLGGRAFDRPTTVMAKLVDEIEAQIPQLPKV